MSKFKIEIELDIDFQKFFDEIPEGLFDSGDDDEQDDIYYEKNAVSTILSETYTNALMKHMDAMANSDYYQYEKHHLKIGEAIAKEIKKNFKITYYEYTKRK